MVSAFGFLIKWTRFEHWPEISHCILGQDASLLISFTTLPLSIQVCRHLHVPAILMLGGQSCNGLASHPGGSRNTCTYIQYVHVHTSHIFHLRFIRVAVHV